MATNHFRKTEKAHQDAIFGKGFEPTNYGADVDRDSPDRSSISSKVSHLKQKKAGWLETIHNHKTGQITHKWSVKPFNEELGGTELDKTENELDEALVAKATLDRYRAHAKKKFREKGGINAALEKQDKADKEKKIEVRKEEAEIDEAEHNVSCHARSYSKENGGTWTIHRKDYKVKGVSRQHAIDKALRKIEADHPDHKEYQATIKEDVEQLDELSPKTLKSYVKKAGGYGRRSAWGLAQKGEKEEDKSMSTDGNKYPEKQERHQKAASKLYHKSNNRDTGLKQAAVRLNKNAEAKSANRKMSMGGHIWKGVLKKEDLNIVDLVMVEDELEATPYIADIEARMNALVAEKKEEMKRDLFNIAEARKPKPGSPGGSWVDPAVADKYKKQAKEKKQFASAKREIDRLKKKGK